MFTPSEMMKVAIIGSKSKLKKTVLSLYKAKAAHIEQFDYNKYKKEFPKESERITLCSPFDEHEQLSNLSLLTGSLIHALKIDRSKTAPSKTVYDIILIEERLNKANDELKNRLEAIKEAESNIALDESLYNSVHGLSLFGITAEQLKVICNQKHLSAIFGRAKKLSGLSKELEIKGATIDIKQYCGKDSGFVFSISPKQKSSQVYDLLKKYSFEQIELQPISEKVSKEPAQFAKELKARIDSNKETAKNLNEEVQALGAEYRQFLVDSEIQLNNALKKTGVPVFFGSTNEAFIVTCWIPTADYNKVKKCLEKTTEDSIYITELAKSKGDVPPTKLNNSFAAKPFEFFLDLFSLPKTSEFDPTTLMFITFPLFYGLMLGDVIYGLAGALLFYILKKSVFKTGEAAKLMNVLLFASIVSMLFGFAFGEYLGFEGFSEHTAEKLEPLGFQLSESRDHHYLSGYGLVFYAHEISHGEETKLVYLFPHVLSRTADSYSIAGAVVPAVLVIGALIGILHLNLGLILGFINKLHHGFMHAVLEKLSWIALELAVVLIILPKLGVPIWWWLGYAVLAAAIVMIYLGDGVIGIVELPSIFSNILSYMRLGAIGLSSVYLAMVINENLGMSMIESGGIGVVFGILVMILGHTINLALGILGPFLHALRLHYVEFFSKFFTGGGRKYLPFGRDE
jgi:V/A-type H+-transporting ATPase subunit I